MAILNFQNVKITVSELLRDGEKVSPILDENTIEQLQSAIQEMVGPGRMVEVESNNG